MRRVLRFLLTMSVMAALVAACDPAPRPGQPSPSALQRTPSGGLSGKLVFMGAPSDQGGNELYSVNADGSDLQRLTRFPPDAVGPDWSPGGERIALETIRGVGPDGLMANIAIIPSGGAVPRDITTSRGNEASPAWSPDGRRIAFAADITGFTDVWTVKPNGEDMKQLTRDADIDQDPSWSPDGNRIAFSSARPGNFEIYVMNSDGSRQQRLTFNSPGEPDLFPAWSPDGESIAFVRGIDGGNLEVFVMNADGSNERRLTDSPGIDGGPAWSPDSEHIAFASERGGRMQIWVMDADGSDPQQVTDIAGLAFGPDWTA